MLKKPNRLPAGSKLRNAYYLKTSIFVLRIAQNNLPVNRFGFVVKKTIDKRAVVRNRVKRVLRSCIEEMHDQIERGHDMLFLLEKGIIGKEREEIFCEIKNLLTEKKLLK